MGPAVTRELDMVGDLRSFWLHSVPHKMRLVFVVCFCLTAASAQSADPNPTVATWLVSVGAVLTLVDALVVQLLCLHEEFCALSQAGVGTGGSASG